MVQPLRLDRCVGGLRLAGVPVTKAKESKGKTALERAEAVYRQLGATKAGARGVALLEGAARSRVPVLPTGSIALDRALGIGGYPMGRIIEVYGPESCGKTTLALHAVANAQARGIVAGYIDAEHAMDLHYAKALGVETAALLFAQPDSGEDALNLVEDMISSGVQLVVIDSIAALTPKAELDGEIGDAHVGLQARMMGQALRKLAGVANKASALLFFINQLRQKIGVIYGSPETTPGGQSMRYYASVRLDVRRREQIKQAGKEDPLGNEHTVKVVKNKMAPPFRTAGFSIIYGRGIDRGADLLDAADAAGLIERSGAWYSYQGERLAQGRYNAIEYLREHLDLAATLEAALRAAS